MPKMNELVKEIFGNSISIISSRTCGGGCINNSRIIELSDGKTVFLKSNSNKFRKMFAREAEGLELLDTGGGPRVPKVYAVKETENHQYLFMECIKSSAKEKDFFIKFGRAFALLHARSNSDFGLDSDNYLGSTVQKNSWKSSWSGFFAENRLLFQFELACRNYSEAAILKKGMENIIKKIADILPEPVRPSLLHGDLWGGNYMTDETGKAVLIDPAVYYGHSEADLAMTELFGGFSPDFYKGYNEAGEIDRSYRKRKDLYNLYHMLNHLNLFGLSYLGSCRSIISKYA